MGGGAWQDSVLLAGRGISLYSTWDFSVKRIGLLTPPIYSVTYISVDSGIFLQTFGNVYFIA